MYSEVTTGMFGEEGEGLRPSLNYVVVLNSLLFSPSDR